MRVHAIPPQLIERLHLPASLVHFAASRVQLLAHPHNKFIKLIECNQTNQIIEYSASVGHELSLDSEVAYPRSILLLQIQDPFDEGLRGFEDVFCPEQVQLASPNRRFLCETVVVQGETQYFVAAADLERY